MTLILGIETSCDETAAAVVRDGRDVLSNVVATQHDLHERYAGVVPEIASRAHLQRITPVIREAMREASVSFDELGAITVGHCPGLIGSLLVGVSAAKALAWSLGKPLVGVDHILAHLHAVTLNDKAIEFPAIGLVVSGGHTSLFLMRSAIDVELLGKTIDDAAGEAFDKAATILGLGYPGGARVDELAQRGDERAHEFPVAQLGRESLDFSYSGLKTGLLYAVRGQPTGRGGGATFERNANSLNESERADFAASFQRAAVRALMRNMNRALEMHEVASIVVGGGVSANSRLRRELEELGRARRLQVRVPAMQYCVDNAAMIAGLGFEMLSAGHVSDWTLSASPRSELASSGKGGA
jgi:N6-L-threonylcarbamoyladenine synthase